MPKQTESHRSVGVKFNRNIKFNIYPWFTNGRFHLFASAQSLLFWIFTISSFLNLHNLNFFTFTNSQPFVYAQIFTFSKVVFASVQIFTFSKLFAFAQFYLSIYTFSTFCSCTNIHIFQVILHLHKYSHFPSYFASAQIFLCSKFVFASAQIFTLSKLFCICTNIHIFQVCFCIYTNIPIFQFILHLHKYSHFPSLFLHLHQYSHFQVILHLHKYSHFPSLFLHLH